MTLHLPKFITYGNQWLEKQQVSILSGAVIITTAALVSGIVGFLRTYVLIAYYYQNGSNPLIDAFYVSFRLPELVFQLLVIGALSAAYIPVFTKYEHQSKESAFRMASSVLNVILLCFVFFSALIFIFAVPITRFMTGSGFSDNQIMVSAQLTRIMIFAQFFFAISNFLSGTIQSYKRFIIPAITPIVYNFGIIIGMVLFHNSLGIYAPAIGVVIGAFLHFALQIPLAIKLGFQYFPTIDLKHPGVREMFRLMTPRTLAVSVDQIELFALTFFATHLAANSIVIINLAQSLMTFPIRLFGAPIGQAALPFLSKESNSGHTEPFRQLMDESLHQISFFAMPASVLLLILRIPIVRLTLGSKGFPWAATVLTGRVVAVLATSIAAQAMVHVLIRALYALHNTKAPLVASMASTAIFLSMSYYSVFYTSWGLLGLAATLSFATIFEMILLLLLLDRKIPFILEKRFWFPQIKIIIASFLMGVFLWLPFRILDQLVFDTTHTVELLGLTVCVSTIAMLTYILFAYLLDIRELSIISRIFDTFGNWKAILSKSPELVEAAGQSSETTM
ncbi:MAG: murein biosynthesis integral membrane protein MurJ [Patescibacteria group bacterium]